MALDTRSAIRSTGAAVSDHQANHDVMMRNCCAARVVGAFGFCGGVRTGAGIDGTIGLGALTPVEFVSVRHRGVCLYLADYRRPDFTAFLT